jgi:hypothetical protein
MTSTPRFTVEEATIVGEAIGIDWQASPFDVEQFRMGMDVELEHGTRNPATNGKIALAHLEEFPDYYTRLAEMEEEGEAAWEAKK